MSYTYLLDAGEESSAEYFADIPASVLSRLNLTAEISYCSGREPESSPSFLCGMMSEPLMPDLGKEKYKWFVEGFLVRISVLLEKAKASQVAEVDCGRSSQESLAKYDPATHSLKIHQNLLIEDSTQSCVTFPDWGMMQDGVCWELTPLEYPNLAKEFGYLVNWPTPCKGSDHWGGTIQ